MGIIKRKKFVTPAALDFLHPEMRYQCWLIFGFLIYLSSTFHKKAIGGAGGVLVSRPGSLAIIDETMK